MKLYDYETITMNGDVLDDGSHVINFDVVDEYNIPTRQGGYVMTRKEENCFTVSVFNQNGDIVSETVVPFNFTEFEEENT
jgi:hypothetical protein